jgi:hypothetical protein
MKIVIAIDISDCRFPICDRCFPNRAGGCLEFCVSAGFRL